MTPVAVGEAVPPEDAGHEPEVDQPDVVPSVADPELSVAVTPLPVRFSPTGRDIPAWHVQSAEAGCGMPVDASTVTHDFGHGVPVAPGARV